MNYNNNVFFFFFLGRVRKMDVFQHRIDQGRDVMYFRARTKDAIEEGKACDTASVMRYETSFAKIIRDFAVPRRWRFVFWRFFVRHIFRASKGGGIEVTGGGNVRSTEIYFVFIAVRCVEILLSAYFASRTCIVYNCFDCVFCLLNIFC